MKIKITSPVYGEVEARVLSIRMASSKIRVRIWDDDENNLGGQNCVPDFMPNRTFGDFIILDIDLDTGQILNWKKPTTEQIEAFINQK